MVNYIFADKRMPNCPVDIGHILQYTASSAQYDKDTFDITQCRVQGCQCIKMLHSCDQMTAWVVAWSRWKKNQLKKVMMMMVMVVVMVIPWWWWWWWSRWWWWERNQLLESPHWCVPLLPTVQCWHPASISITLTSTLNCIATCGALYHIVNYVSCQPCFCSLPKLQEEREGWKSCTTNRLSDFVRQGCWLYCHVHSGVSG